MIRRLLAVYFLALGLLAVPAMLFAQETPVPPNLEQVAIDSINALIAPLTLVVLWGVKSLWSKIPAALVLFAGPVFGMAVNFGSAYLTGHQPTNAVVAALLGAAATWGREIVDTVITKGVSGPITETKLNF